MKRKITEGRGKTVIQLPHLTMDINHSEVGLVSNDTSLSAPSVIVEYYWEAAIPASEDEPFCGEYLELLSIRPQSPIYLTNNYGLCMSIDSRCDMVNLLDESQYEELCELLKKSYEDYTDNDLLRAPVSNRARQELGFGLEANYNYEVK